MLPRHLSIIIISLLLTACTTETGKKLTHADSVMEQHPDSAMSILSEIDRNTLKDSELPYFALLYTQAQVKTDVPLDSDSLISIAYAKYGANTRGDRGIRSNFYTGEIFFNQNKYREAMRYYLTAYEESKRLNNDYWHAKAAERMADLFYLAYNYDEAARYSQEAANLFKQVNRQINHRYTLAQLARTYLNNGYEENAYFLLDSLKTLCLKEIPVDSTFLDYIKLPLVKAITLTGRINDITLDSIDFYSQEMSDVEFLDAAILQSEAYRAIHKSNDVKYSLNNIEYLAQLDEDKVHVFYAQYEDAKAIEDTYLAISLVDSMLYYQNKVAEDIIQGSVTGAQRDFYSEMAVLNKNQSLFLKMLLYVSLFVFVLVVIFVLVIFHYRNKAQKSKFEASLESFLSLKAYSDKISLEKSALEESIYEKSIQRDLAVNQLEALLDEKKKQEISYSEIVERLFKEKWTTIDALCDQYFGLNNSEITAKGLVTNIEKELKKIVSKKGLIEIVEAVDTYMGGIVTNIKAQCPFLKEDDLNFLALLYAGFSVRAVCMFTGIKYPHFYVKKSRLLKRIQTSEAPDKSLFLEKLK